MTYQNILVSTEESVAIVTLNRPDVLNALNQATMNDLVETLDAFDRDETVRCVILTGASTDNLVGTDTQRFVYQVYEDVWWQAPDIDGLNFWTNQLEHGLDRLAFISTLTARTAA